MNIMVSDKVASITIIETSTTLTKRGRRFRSKVATTKGGVEATSANHHHSKEAQPSEQNVIKLKIIVTAIIL